MRFFDKALRDNDLPEKVTMDQSGANKADIDRVIEDKNISVIVRQVKYLNNIVEQDHRAVKPSERTTVDDLMLARCKVSVDLK